MRLLCKTQTDKLARRVEKKSFAPFRSIFEILKCLARPSVSRKYKEVICRSLFSHTHFLSATAQSRQMAILHTWRKKRFRFPSRPFPRPIVKIYEDCKKVNRGLSRDPSPILPSLSRGGNINSEANLAAKVDELIFSLHGGYVNGSEV